MTPESKTPTQGGSPHTDDGIDSASADSRPAENATADDVRRLEQELADAYVELRKAEDRINSLVSLMGTQSYRLGSLIAATSRKCAPAGTARRRALTSIIAAAREARTDPRLLLSRGSRLSLVDLRWNRFCNEHDPSPASLRGMRELSTSWDERPLVSIVMPTYEPQGQFFRAAIDSVRAQAYQRWELCIVDDGSPTDAAAKIVEGYRDTRIRFSTRSVNGGIAAASQTAADMATGDLIAFLDHDDVLRPHAIFEMVSYLRAHPMCDLLYSDEDKLDPWKRRVEAHLKPDWSPELMDSCNYMCHFTAIRRDLFDRAGGFRSGFDGSQDHDLFLRCAELAKEIGHVREVLYSWRINVGSSAGSTEAKPEANRARVQALEDRLARSGETGTVAPSELQGASLLRRTIVGAPTIGVIIPTRDAVDLLEMSVACVEEESTQLDVRIVIVDNGSADAATLEYLDRCGHLVVRAPGAFNFSRLVNRGVTAAGPVDHILLFNNDVVRGRPGWLGALVEHSQRPGIGAVGARLLYEDGTPQHEGIWVGTPNGPAENLDLSGYFGMGLVARNVSAVTGACLMVKRVLWEELGGFDEELHVALNDVDFCLRLLRAGYRNVYTPAAELTHLESATRGRRHPVEDEQLFVSRWGPFPQGFDRYVGRSICAFDPVAYS
ncbi:MAG TPA: glycosyltransferase family 2 protein [Candidatus Dormibacteraeota bacterium]